MYSIENLFVGQVTFKHKEVKTKKKSRYWTKCYFCSGPATASGSPIAIAAFRISLSSSSAVDMDWDCELTSTGQLRPC